MGAGLFHGLVAFTRHAPRPSPARSSARREEALLAGRWAGGRRHVTITRHESVYREVAEKGYHLPPGSPVDPYWLTWVSMLCLLRSGCSDTWP